VLREKKKTAKHTYKTRSNLQTRSRVGWFDLSPFKFCFFFFKKVDVLINQG
jgi:hypothetical protein